MKCEDGAWRWIHLVCEDSAMEPPIAIIKDPSTIRADRDKHYFGADGLFERHADIVKTFCDEAPVLPRRLLTGLMCRSRMEGTTTPA